MKLLFCFYVLGFVYRLDGTQNAAQVTENVDKTRVDVWIKIILWVRDAIPTYMHYLCDVCVILMNTFFMGLGLCLQSIGV